MLVTTRGPVPSDDEFLLALHQRKVGSCSVVGVDPQRWEDMLDWVAVEADLDLPSPEDSHTILTSSHPDETREDVIQFAGLLFSGEERVVHVIEV